MGRLDGCNGEAISGVLSCIATGTCAPEAVCAQRAVGAAYCPAGGCCARSVSGDAIAYLIAVGCGKALLCISGRRPC